MKASFINSYSKHTHRLRLKKIRIYIEITYKNNLCKDGLKLSVIMILE